MDNCGSGDNDIMADTDNLVHHQKQDLTVERDIDLVAPPEPLTDERLAELDRQARKNYEIKFSIVPNRVIYIPSIDTFYYNHAETAIASVPDDLRLEVYLGQFNSLARYKFTALKTEVYGPKMVMAWALAMHKSGEEVKVAVDDQDAERESWSTRNAKMDARRKAAMDKANGGTDNILARVPWESELLKALLNPLDHEAETAVSNLKRKKVHTNTPWIKPWDFIKLLKEVSFLQEMEGLVQGTDALLLKREGKKGEEDLDMDMEL